MARAKRPKVICRLCGSSRSSTQHHMIPKQRMTRTESTGWITPGIPPSEIRNSLNVVILCRHHHNMIERGILRGMLRDLLSEQETMHIERTAPGFLETHYPRGTDARE